MAELGAANGIASSGIRLAGVRLPLEAGLRAGAEDRRAQCVDESLRTKTRWWVYARLLIPHGG